MSKPMPLTEPVQDTVPRVDGAIAVGEDLDFQHSWWKFERIIWVLFGLILIADLAGGFGRGYLANAVSDAADGSLHIQYERIARANTPSIMTITIEPSAIQERNGSLQLFVNDSIIKGLGAQRVIPQPEHSALTTDGLVYTFPVQTLPATIQIALEPSFPGVHHFQLQVPGHSAIRRDITVLP